MFSSPLPYRLAIDLLVLTTLSTSYITAHQTWHPLKFLHFQCPVQFQLLLLGTSLFYTSLRCALTLALHHPLLTAIYTYLFSAGTSPTAAPSPFRYPGFVVFCAVVLLSYGARWLRTCLVIGGHVRPTEFRPSKFTRPVEHWLTTRRDRSREAQPSVQPDPEKLPLALETTPPCESCHFLVGNSSARRIVACVDLASLVLLTALLDAYLANRNGWVSAHLSGALVLLGDILGWEFFAVFGWLMWVDVAIACVEARFERMVADRCRREGEGQGVEGRECELVLISC